MKKFPHNYDPKTTSEDSNNKILTNSAINYFEMSKVFKRFSNNDNDKHNLTNISPNKSKNNSVYEKQITTQPTPFNDAKKYVYPTSMENLYFKEHDVLRLRLYERKKNFNAFQKEKNKFQFIPKTTYSRNSLNLNNISNSKITLPTRNSINYSNQNNHSYFSTQNKLEEIPESKSKSKEKLAFKKNATNKENYFKSSHTRHTSSYVLLSRNSKSFFPKIDSTPKLERHPRVFKTSIKQIETQMLSTPKKVEQLFFEENQMNISICSEQEKTQNQITARFNFIEEKLPEKFKAFAQTSTSLQMNLDSSKRRPVMLSQFILGPCKGKGRYGKVYFAVDRQTGFLCALKEISLSFIRQMLPQLINEIKIQSFLDHSYITKIYGYFVEKDSIYIIMQYMVEGNLFDLIKRNGPLSERKAAIKLHQISQALSHIHSYRIIHRDLKPENIVINFGVCKLCDFGWAVKYSKKRLTNCGTLDYLSPQMIQGNSYSSSIDLWAMGVILYEMIIGKPPFYNISAKQTAKRIKQCCFTLPEILSGQSKSLIECFLRKDPSERRQIDGILKHPFFEQIDEQIYE